MVTSLAPRGRSRRGPAAARLRLGSVPSLGGARPAGQASPGIGRPFPRSDPRPVPTVAEGPREQDPVHPGQGCRNRRAPPTHPPAVEKHPERCGLPGAVSSWERLGRPSRSNLAEVILRTRRARRGRILRRQIPPGRFQLPGPSGSGARRGTLDRRDPGPAQSRPCAWASCSGRPTSIHSPSRAKAPQGSPWARAASKSAVMGKKVPAGTARTALGERT